jgi:hypothetical protein
VSSIWSWGLNIFDFCAYLKISTLLLEQLKRMTSIESRISYVNMPQLVLSNADSGKRMGNVSQESEIFGRFASVV